MQAFILAGGLGTRLHPIMNGRPKAMASPGGRPFLEHQLEWLRDQGVGEVVLCLGHLHEEIRNHFGDGRAWGVQVAYSVEPSPQGTGGALKRAQPLVSGPFLTLNGDSYLALDLAALGATHRANRQADPCAMGLLALTRVDDVRSYGSVSLDTHGRIDRFIEKSDRAAVPGWINAGVYVFEPALLDLIPSGMPVSLERETFPSLLAQGHHLYGCPTEGRFIDIGTPDGYRQFECYLMEARQ